MHSASMSCAAVVLALTPTAIASTFPGIPGPITVGNTNVTIPLNDVLNGAGVAPGIYASATINASWAVGAGSPWSSEAVVSLNGSPERTAATGAALNGNATNLTFHSGFGGMYNPAVNGLLDLQLRQNFGTPTTLWSDITVTLNLLIDLGSISGSSLNFNTEGSSLSTLNDTEIAVYDANGVLLGSDDDGGTEYLSSLTLANLADGRYYIAVAGYNAHFANAFDAYSNSIYTGTTVVNVTNGTDTLTGGGSLVQGQVQWYTINVPTPGTCAMFALVGTLALRRRR